MRAFVCILLALGACTSSAPRGAAPGSDGLEVDAAPSLRGIPDRGDDPAVVLLDVGGGRSCSGVLLAADVVLTAKDCLPSPVSALRVLSGDDRATVVERARGVVGLVPPPSDAGIALVLLDAALDERAPLVAAATSPATGDHVRAVGFSDDEEKLVRDHAAVVASAEQSFDVSEAPCTVLPGGPAVDESTGEVVGVLGLPRPTCVDRDEGDTYARVDVARSWMSEVLGVWRPAAAVHGAKAKKGPIDLGAACERGGDCAAGICISYRGARYCSRTCSVSDRCPARWRCARSRDGRDGSKVCVQR